MTSNLIEDYALLGDFETAALVSLDGSIDWLCWPRFDSAACFAALLGTEENGRWRIAPTGEVIARSRRYRGDTLILETEIETADGTVLVTDFMPPYDGRSELVRIVEGISGEVTMQTDLVLRFDYGAVVPWVTRADERTHYAIAGPDLVTLRSNVPVHGERNHTVGVWAVKAGETHEFVLTWCPSHLPAPAELHAGEALVRTEREWNQWCERCTYSGQWRGPVMRSLVVLKALIFEPTGGIVAAPTTSLPEEIGGVRNWDYRFCWLRDATLTLLALINAGYIEEAGAWRSWLLRAAAGSPDQVQIMYGLSGERMLREFDLPWLSGYENSTPVRVGNAAHGQIQLDVYGEVMDALYQARVAGLAASSDAWALECALMSHVERVWQLPDQGLWEVRGPAQHFVHSKVMAWVAVDRAVKTVEEYGLEGPLEKWRALRQTIHDEVCERGYDPELRSFVQAYGSKLLDASTLMLSLVGFLPGDDPRMIGTVNRIEKHLVADGFVLRYDSEVTADGLPPGEGAFLACSFWLADNYTLQGRRNDAVALFERLVGLSNDLGLLAEMYDPERKRLVGNFPQAFSHIALLSTAYNLERRGVAAVEKPAVQRGAV